MSTPYRARRRAELFQQQNGSCYWCHEPMQLLESYPPNGKLEADVCTLDHLFHRGHPDRTKLTHDISRYVAACWQCNQDRGLEFERRMKTGGMR